MSSKSDRDNRSNQLNPNNDAYYSSRGSSRSVREYDDDLGAASWSLSPSFVGETWPSHAETFGFAAVALNGSAIVRTAEFEVVEGSRDIKTSVTAIAEFVDDFERLVRYHFTQKFKPDGLALFAVFDPTRICPPWRVSFDIKSVAQVGPAFQQEGIQICSSRLKPLPPRLDDSLHRSLSFRKGPSPAVVEWERLASEQLDIVPFMAALRAVVNAEAPSMGTFQVSGDGRISR